jgi:HEPN domain-containing protein
MLQLDLGRFAGRIHKIAAATQIFQDASHDRSGLLMSVEDLTDLKNDIAELGQIAIDLDLPMVISISQRLGEQLNTFNKTDTLGRICIPFPEIINPAADLQRVVQFEHEAKGKVLLVLDAGGQKLWLADAALFGNEVECKFPASSFDIQEAGNCFAVGRYTACVFHLMRAAESAVSVLANAIGATVVNANGETLSWGVLLSNIKPKIEAMPKGQLQDEWLKAHALLHSCNRAYRTKTAHPSDKYTEEGAEAAFNATRSFMRELAGLV